MFPLLSLPNELILHVIDQLHPTTIEPLAACGNKKVKSLIKERLNQHRNRKADYSTLVFGGYQVRERFQERCGWQISSPFNTEDCACRFISKYIQDNDLAHYPKTLCLDTSDFDDDECEYGLEFTLAQAVGSKLPSKVVSSIRLCAFPEEEEEEASSDDTVNHSCSNWDLDTAVLFAILPNLKSVFIVESHDGDLLRGCFSRFVRHVAAASRRTGATPHNFERALPLLKELTIEFDDISGGDEVSQENIQTFTPFAMLPSMRTLQGRCVTGRNDSDEYCSSVFLRPFDMPERSLSIETISFINSAVNAPTFKRFIEGFTALREFTYHHEGSFDGAVVYQPQDLVEVLRTFAADTLVKLDLSAQQSELCFREKIGQHLISLRAFTALKFVRVDDAIFVGPDWENAVEDISEDQDTGMTETSDGDTNSKNGLCSLLPITCETLNLVHYRRGTWKLFRNLLEHKDSHLPNLKKITIEDTNWMNVRMVQWPDPLDPLLDDAMKEAFEDAGIECATVRSEVSYSYCEGS